tara:strand:+ start:762 stop:1148 length:387 start_codon:yes stop_codon:yes gene_type:complete
MRTIFNILLICSSAYCNSAIYINFNIESLGQPLPIIQLKASIKAKEILRNNAYLGLDPLISKDFSTCWLNFLKNRKVIITTTGNSYFLQGNNNNIYRYQLEIEPLKIKVHDYTKNDFINYCIGNYKTF